jgi:2,3-bisphosphoglycerate-dependent phosphoglycerate mutase
MRCPQLLVLVRHAESERNVAKKGNAFFADDESRKALRGVPDHRVPLTERGRKQAEEAGLALFAEVGRLDVVYTSGYLRTEQTAAGVLGAWPAAEREALPLTHDLFIRERDAGHAYDMTNAEAAEAFPWMEGYWKTTGPFFARPPGGESVAQVCERVRLFLDRVGVEHAGERVMVVTHGVALRAFRYLLEGWSIERMEHELRGEGPPNASATLYEAEHERLVLRAAHVVHWK